MSVFVSAAASGLSKAASLPAEQLRDLGVDPGLLRLSELLAADHAGAREALEVDSVDGLAALPPHGHSAWRTAAEKLLYQTPALYSALRALSFASLTSDDELCLYTSAEAFGIAGDSGVVPHFMAPIHRLRPGL